MQALHALKPFHPSRLLPASNMSIHPTNTLGLNYRCSRRYLFAFHRFCSMRLLCSMLCNRIPTACNCPRTVDAIRNTDGGCVGGNVVGRQRRYYFVLYSPAAIAAGEHDSPNYKSPLLSKACDMLQNKRCQLEEVICHWHPCIKLYFSHGDAL